MKNEEFDRMLSNIRSEQLDDQVVEQAGQRVWKSITGGTSDCRTWSAYPAKLR